MGPLFILLVVAAFLRGEAPECGVSVAEAAPVAKELPAIVSAEPLSAAIPPAAEAAVSNPAPPERGLSSTTSPERSAEPAAVASEATKSVAAAPAEETSDTATPMPATAPLGGKVDAFATAFNAKAKRMEIGVRVAKRQCETALRVACSYAITSGVAMVAGSAPDKKTLETLSIHVLTDDKADAVRYLASLAIILAMYAPKADTAEIGAVVSELVDKIGRGRDPDVTLHGVTVKVTSIQPFGTITNISRD